MGTLMKMNQDVLRTAIRIAGDRHNIDDLDVEVWRVYNLIMGEINRGVYHVAFKAELEKAVNELNAKDADEPLRFNPPLPEGQVNERTAYLGDSGDESDYGC